jgi:hypothetical protein
VPRCRIATTNESIDVIPGDSGDPTKRVKGWETYKVEAGGSSLICTWEVETIWPGGSDLNDGKMRIAFDETRKVILGTDVDGRAGSDDWSLSLKRDLFSVQNSTYRFKGKLNRRRDTITGKWEQKGNRNRWRYWYDKVMTKTGARL